MTIFTLKQTILSAAIAAALLGLSQVALAAGEGRKNGIDGEYHIEAPRMIVGGGEESGKISGNIIIITNADGSNGGWGGYKIIAGLGREEGSTVERNKIEINMKDSEIISNGLTKVELYGAYVAPPDDNQNSVSEEDLINLKNNEIVNTQKVKIATSRDTPSKLVGAGEYLDDEKLTYYTANAYNNSVKLTNAELDKNIVILGGGGRTVSENEVNIKDATITDFSGKLIGGRGVIATSNSLKLSNVSYTLNKELNSSDEHLETVGGGYGILLAENNKVEITANRENSVNGSFVGGISQVNASSNSINAGGQDLKLGGKLFGALIVHKSNETSLNADKNTVKVTQHIGMTGEDKLNVTGAAALFLLDTAAKNVQLSMEGNSVSIEGGFAGENKPEVGEVIGNAIIVKTENIPDQITATGTKISLTNAIAESVHGVVISETGVNNHYNVDAGTTISLYNAEVKGEVGFIEQNGAQIKTTGSEESVLEAEGVNKIGTFGNDIKRIHLNVSDVNKDNAVIIFTSKENKEYSGLEVKAKISKLSRMMSSDSPDEQTAEYKLFGSMPGSGTTRLSGTIEFSGTFTSALQGFSGVVSDGSSLTVSQLNTGRPPYPTDPSYPVITATSNAKTLSESLLGSMALITQGAEFIADEGLSAINAAAQANAVTAFGAMTGGHVRYETGSHVNVDGGSMTLGAATKWGETTVAGFFEFGRADSKAHVAGTKADGDHQSYGVGLAARHAITDHVYVDGSLRAGRSETKFDGFYASTGEKAHYDAKSTYVSAHLTGGYLFNVTSSLVADVYARGIVSYLGSDTVSLGTSDNEKAHFNSTTAETLQLGARLKGNVAQNAFWRVGAGWIHVFDGDANASVFVDGLAPAKIESPSLSGNAVVFDAGFTMKPSEASPWTLDFALKGYAGDRRGVTGTLQAGYRF